MYLNVASSYYRSMTPDEIHSFIQRLACRELKPGELSALTPRDLGDINCHLAEYAETDLDPNRKILELSAVDSGPPERTYSEKEILLEFSVLE